jgi:hypothetical protein
MLKELSQDVDALFRMAIEQKRFDPASLSEQDRYCGAA